MSTSQSVAVMPGRRMSHGEQLARNARRFPDRVAFEYIDRVLTYGELDARVNRLARGLQTLGVDRGDRVAVLMLGPARVDRDLFCRPQAGRDGRSGELPALGPRDRLCTRRFRFDRDEGVKEIAEHCKSLIASYKKPTEIVVVDALPRNAVSKVQKFKLREQLAPR